MNQDILLPIFTGLLITLVVLGLGAFGFVMHSKQLLQPRAGRKGEWVAEVWLEWEICRGSTMYRQRFSQRWMAHAAAKFHAVVLDWYLPTHYRDTDWHGRPCWYKHEYEIRFGVRKVLTGEAKDFAPVWSEEMPGHQGYSGEHAMSHPFERWNGELQGSTADFKV